MWRRTARFMLTRLRLGSAVRMFFFEKKNQKTFATLVGSLAQARGFDSNRQLQKFFGSFFQKRTSFLPVA
jgi:hypothetical protein